MKKIMVVLALCLVVMFAFKYNVKAEVKDYNSNPGMYIAEIEKNVNDQGKIINKDNVAGASDKSGFNPDMEQFTPDFGKSMTCKELLGPTLVKFIKTVRITVQSIGVAIAIANGMLTFVPAITSKDSSALNKAFEKFVKLMAILAFLLLLPTLINFIGKLAGFDLSCL